MDDASVPWSVAVGPASVPRFSCTRCGACCTGNQVVRLAPTDLRLLARHLGLASVVDLRTTGLVTWVREPVGGGRFAWRPRLRFRTRPLHQCPFLVNQVDPDGAYQGLCALHPDAKPLVCHLSPLAREVEDPGTDPASETWAALAPVEGCPGWGQGDPLLVGRPEALGPRLDEETRWMRHLIALSPGLPDASAAWALVDPLP